MYPRNAATPPRIAVGPVVQISDGAVQTSGASVTVTPEGGNEGAGGGTLACLGTSGVWTYVPTQAETNYTAFCVTVYKTGCIPATVTVVTTACTTAGKVDVGAVVGSTGAAANLVNAVTPDTAWYVEGQNGNDSNDGHSWATARATLPANASDYANAWALFIRRHSGISGATKIDLSSAPSNFTIDAHGGLIFISNAGLPGITCAANQTVWIRNAYITRGSQYALVQGGEYTVIENCVLSAPTLAVTVGNGTVVIRDSIILGNLTVTGSGAIVVQNCQRISGTDTGNVTYANVTTDRLGRVDLGAIAGDADILAQLAASLYIEVGVANVEVDLESIFDSGEYAISLAPAGFDSDGYPTWSYGPEGDPPVTVALDYDHEMDEWVLAWSEEMPGGPITGEHRSPTLGGVYQADPLVSVTPSAADSAWWCQAAASRDIPAAVWASTDRTLTALNASIVTGAFGTSVLAAAPTGSTITYAVQRATAGEAPRLDLVAYQHMALGPYSITCDVSQSGKQHKFCVYARRSSQTILWTLDNSHITVGGTGNKTLTIADTDAYTKTDGTYWYRLVNVTDDILLCQGALSIESGPDVK